MHDDRFKKLYVKPKQGRPSSKPLSFKEEQDLTVSVRVCVPISPIVVQTALGADGMPIDCVRHPPSSLCAAPSPRRHLHQTTLTRR